MGNGTVTKERILHKAMDLFARHGFEGARMEKIAGEVGINKASLYFHFKSKEDIFRALFQQILTNYKETLMTILEETKSMPTRERLTAIYERYLEYNWNNTEMDFWNRMYYLPPQSMREEIIHITLDSAQSFCQELTAIMEEGLRKQELRPLNPVHMAKSFYYILTCISISFDMIDREQGLTDMENCFQVFWEGIKAI